MALLSSHLQVRPGLLHAVLECLIQNGAELSRPQIVSLLQPPALTELYEGGTPPAIAGLGIDALAWLDLIEISEVGVVSLAPAANGLTVANLVSELPSRILEALLHERRHTDMGGLVPQTDDLVDALAWFLAQDAWNPPLAYERVVESVELRQQRQFPNGPELVNKTKWNAVCVWAEYLGLGARDPAADATVPDPTVALREISASLEGRGPIAASQFVRLISEQVAVFDQGIARLRTMSSLAEGLLPWESDGQVISPSLSLALARLEIAGAIQMGQEADSDPQARLGLSLVGDDRVFDTVTVGASG